MRAPELVTSQTKNAAHVPDQLPFQFADLSSAIIAESLVRMAMMNQIDDVTVNQTTNEAAQVTDAQLVDEDARQLALRKISRRYAAYIVPLTLAVLVNNAHAGS